MKKSILGKMIAFCGTVLLVMGLTGCGQGGNSAPSVTKADIVGEYVETGDYDVKYISLTEDGKFISDITTSMGLKSHSENTWDYEGGTLTLHYLEYGTDSVYSVSFNGDTMILDNGNAKRELIKK